MRRKSFAAPPKWTTAQLKTSRDHAEQAFREAWRAEGPGAVQRVCAELWPQVESLMLETDSLRRINGDVFRADPDLWQLLRYVCAPVLSEENFWTLVGSPKSKRVSEKYADDAAEVIVPVIDPVRFPWVAEARNPTALESHAAVLATVVLLAAQRVGTTARSGASRRQEAAVAAVLEDAGYEVDPSNARIAVIDDIARGRYSAERRVADAKCDVPVRLRDGRLLAIECKVSIGPKNGWKRINRETGGKADQWRLVFGQNMITAVVIDGVFDLGCLDQAQEKMVVFWEREIDALSEFLRACG